MAGSEDAFLGVWFRHAFEPRARHGHVMVPTRSKGGSKAGVLVAWGGNVEVLDDVSMVDFDYRSAKSVWRRLDLKSLPIRGRAGCATAIMDIPFGDGTTHQVVVLFGGVMEMLAHDEYTSELCVLDLTTSTWMVDALDTASEIPLARIGATLCEVGHRAILFGGVSQAGAYLNDVYMLEWDSGKRRFHWTRTQTTGKGPTARADHTCVASHDGTLVVFGGRDATRRFNSVHVLDPSSRTWRTPSCGGAAPKPRSMHAACSAAGGHQMIVSGGWVGDDPAGRTDATTELFVLCLDTFSWSSVTQVGEVPRRRAGHRMCFMDGRAVMSGGRDGHLFREVKLRCNRDMWSLELRRVKVSGGGGNIGGKKALEAVAVVDAPSSSSSRSQQSSRSQKADSSQSRTPQNKPVFSAWTGPPVVLTWQAASRQNQIKLTCEVTGDFGADFSYTISIASERSATSYSPATGVLCGPCCAIVRLPRLSNRERFLLCATRAGAAGDTEGTLPVICSQAVEEVPVTHGPLRGLTAARRDGTTVDVSWQAPLGAAPDCQYAIEVCLKYPSTMPASHIAHFRSASAEHTAATPTRAFQHRIGSYSFYGTPTSLCNASVPFVPAFMDCYFRVRQTDAPISSSLSLRVAASEPPPPLPPRPVVVAEAQPKRGARGHVEAFSSQPAVSIGDVAAGDAVEVKEGTRWYRARILEHDTTRGVFIHYEGWKSTFDEWIAPEDMPERVRAARADSLPDERHVKRVKQDEAT